MAVLGARLAVSKPGSQLQLHGLSSSANRPQSVQCYFEAEMGTQGQMKHAAVTTHTKGNFGPKSKKSLLRPECHHSARIWWDWLYRFRTWELIHSNHLLKYSSNNSLYWVNGLLKAHNVAWNICTWKMGVGMGVFSPNCIY